MACWGVLPGASHYTRLVADVAQDAASTEKQAAQSSRLDRRFLVLDALLLSAILLFVLRAWSWGALRSEVSSDSFMALECGWRFLTHGFTRPSQQLFGYGVCAQMAPLFVGADSLWEVSVRRSLVGGAVVPLTYLFVLVAAPWVARLSPLATRAAALTATVLVARNEPLGHATMSGGHGYFAFTCIAVAVLCWAIAVRRRARLLCILGFLLVPWAMMNHPYSGWLLFVGLALVPALLRTTGWLSVLLGLAGGVAVASPRLFWITGRLGKGDSFADLVGAGGDTNIDGVFRYVLVEISTLPITLGVLFLGFLAVRAFRSKEGSPGAKTWGVAMVGGLLGWVLLYLGIGGYVRDYHVIQLYPFGVLGWGLAMGLLMDRGLKALGGSTAGRRRVAVASALFLVLALGTLRFAGGASEASPPKDFAYRFFLGASFEPWRTPGALRTTTAGGNYYYHRAIVEDMRNKVPSDRPVLITNFNSAERREDSSVALALSMYLSGFPSHRVSCCREGQAAPVWYWIVDNRGVMDSRGADLDYRTFFDHPDSEVLAELQNSDELLVVFRSEEALQAIGKKLCSALPPTRQIGIHYYMDWLTLMNGNNYAGYRYPGLPIPLCLKDQLMD
ncbi:MAG: hypothetical protein VX498_12160 [Myxococcota bacterium]|nr:hypothetical protein [Myxococcota bacterium]